MPCAYAHSIRRGYDAHFALLRRGIMSGDIIPYDNINDVGSYHEIEESSEIIYIASDFPDEYASSESRLALKGAVAKAKANASQGIPELIQIATNETFSENTKKKHEKDAKLGWYRYDVRFALPVYDDKSGELVRYNIFSARMLVRYADDGKKYLYDLLAIKKETSSPL